MNLIAWRKTSLPCFCVILYSHTNLVLEKSPTLPNTQLKVPQSWDVLERDQWYLLIRYAYYIIVSVKRETIHKTQKHFFQHGANRNDTEFRR